MKKEKEAVDFKTVRTLTQEAPFLAEAPAAAPV